ncbi:hypothetical protein ACFWFZ_02410 [Streptomyces sp. NPDC060232]|uniref:hypothetical protein n=1 Tax=Streptomyces sp. NPDC060232 TaxID=3347079 RepID=UPI00365236FB
MLRPVPRGRPRNGGERALRAFDGLGFREEGCRRSAVSVVLTLPPAERLAFVLHDLFAAPFDEVAPVLGRIAAATRQLTSHGRRRVQGVVPRSGSGPRLDDLERLARMDLSAVAVAD